MHRITSLPDNPAFLYPVPVSGGTPEFDFPDIRPDTKNSGIPVSGLLEDLIIIHKFS
jgi:hypothetical protein